jgi:hypothetical protein
MSCRNHPQTPAAATCTGCAEPFCKNCLVQLAGQNYCGSCKVLALNGRELSLESQMRHNNEAREAMKMAYIGIFCFGIILGPMAMGKGIGARKIIKNDPMLLGSGKAIGAVVIGAFVLVLWAIKLFAHMAA